MKETRASVATLYKQLAASGRTCPGRERRFLLAHPEQLAPLSERFSGREPIQYSATSHQEEHQHRPPGLVVRQRASRALTSNLASASLKAMIACTTPAIAPPAMSPEAISIPGENSASAALCPFRRRSTRYRTIPPTKIRAEVETGTIAPERRRRRMPPRRFAPPPSRSARAERWIACGRMEDARIQLRWLTSSGAKGALPSHGRGWVGARTSRTP
jgi:hypothetical protein